MKYPVVRFEQGGAMSRDINGYCAPLDGNDVSAGSDDTFDGNGPFLLSRIIAGHLPVVFSAAVLIIIVTITGLIESPAMVDYMNHLARMELIASGRPNPAYVVHWEFIPNLAMDLLVPPLAQLIGAAAATKAFLIASQVLVVSGAIALEYAVKGRLGLAGLAALPVLFSTSFGWGLLNLNFALGIAVWGIAAWVALRERGWILWVVHSAFVLALLVGHLFALGLYGLVIGVIELSRGERLEPLRLARLAVPMAAPVVLLLALMWLSGASLVSKGLAWDFSLKMWWPLRVLNVHNPMLGAVTGAVLGGLILALLLTKRLKLSRTGWWIALALVVVYIALPLHLAGSFYVDVRVICAAMLILPAFCRLSGAKPLVVVTLGAITVANGASMFLLWQSRQVDYAEIRATFPLIKEGSAVLVARDDAFAPTDTPLYYAPTLAAPEAGAFVASLYAFPGMQPVAARAAFKELEVASSIEYLPPTISELRAPRARHLVRWQERYKYLFVIGEPRASSFPTLHRIASGRRFALYRIAPSP